MSPILGKSPTGNVSIDVDRLIVSRMLLTANSGGGKSWALRRLLEQTHGAIQQLVIDPEGEFFTLREHFDYVLAGKGGDCPAEPRSAALLARRLLELGTSAIVDLYELAPRERVRFVRLFVEALIDAPRELWHPALVVIDEAHAFAPERGHGEAESADAIARLMAQGRKRGFAGVLATQRLSKLAKDVAAEANNVLIGRAALDVDQKRAAAALGMSAADAASKLRSLRPGHFYAFGPAISGDVGEIHLGDVKTSHPKAGQRAAPPPPPRERVRKILGQLADLPKEAEAELRTITDARQRVAQLERELAAARRAQPEPKVERVEVPVLAPSVLADLRALSDELAGVAHRVHADAGAIAEACSRAHAQPPRVAPVRNGHAPAAPQPRRVAARTGAGAGDESVGQGGLRRILVALAQRPQGLTNGQLGVRAGLSSRSGTFSTYISRARSAGWIDGRGTVTITDAGVEALGAYEPLPTGRALLDYWLGELGDSGAARLLRAYADAYPGALTNADAGAVSGLSPASGTFSTYLSRLRSLELIEGRGEVRASAELFD